MTTHLPAGLHGWELFARFAFPPNELGYCGPPDATVLLPGGGHDEIVGHAQGFDGAWPYLEEIAAASGYRRSDGRRGGAQLLGRRPAAGTPSTRAFS